MSSPVTTVQPQSGPGGVIHDIGYRRYTGPRLGRAYATRSLFAHSLRTAYGLGRSVAAKIFPWGILGLLVSVAAILVTIQSQIPPGVDQRAFTYWQFPSLTSILVLLFCAVAAPELVSRDLRSGVLPLYFSRPLSRADYTVAKFAALTTAVFVLMFIPLLTLFLGSAFSQDSMSAVGDEFVLFTQGVVVAALMALLFSAIALLVASLSGRRAVAAALIVGLFILTTPVLGVLQIFAWANGEPTGAALTLSQLSFLVSPFTIVDGIGGWWFDQDEPTVGPYGPLYLAVMLAITAICLLLTLVRYRKVAR
ncbi:MAG: ABC transporter permease subunit [Micromonosporaceae bacterium]|nr:ABC transporter permease subunit [Micromonosporaceae bacterium]